VEINPYICTVRKCKAPAKMDQLKKISPYKLVLIALLGAAFIIFPNITFLSWELDFLPKSGHAAHLSFFGIRYLFLVILIGSMLWYNLCRITGVQIKKRLIHNTVIIVVAYSLYVLLSMRYGGKKADCFGGVLVSQFFVVYAMCSFAGHLAMLYIDRKSKEQEIERLKIDNLQSRCEALTNQLNPHFFFNSLNGLAALIRKKNETKTLEYVDKLSDVFRYILQSDRKGLVTLEEELEFMQAFRYMMEVRFANKLTFSVDVPENKLGLRIPVLSLLPLIDNVVVHNIIDSDHKMEVDIRLNDRDEIVVTNPIFPKTEPPITNGTGLQNLTNRFLLLMDKQIRFDSDGVLFRVYLPLK